MVVMLKQTKVYNYINLIIKLSVFGTLNGI